VFGGFAFGGFFLAVFGHGGFFGLDDVLGTVFGAFGAAAFFGSGVGWSGSGGGFGVFARAAAFALADFGAFGCGEFEAVA